MELSDFYCFEMADRTTVFWVVLFSLVFLISPIPHIQKRFKSSVYIIKWFALSYFLLERKNYFVFYFVLLYFYNQSFFIVPFQLQNFQPQNGYYNIVVSKNPTTTLNFMKCFIINIICKYIFVIIITIYFICFHRQ